MTGSIIMLPVPISESDLQDSLPQSTIDAACRLEYFLAENAKSARAFLKKAGHPKPISELSIVEIGHRPDILLVDRWLEPIKAGHDIGILSEAGCPGIADPGAQVVRRAQFLNYRVKPLIGPCSMILALMASGLDGQHFSFCGYIPVKEPERSKTIKELERKSSNGEGETQLFIETPYRNNQLLKDLVLNCQPDTLILIATDITGKDESIKTKTVAEWKSCHGELPKLPTIFGLLGQKKFRQETKSIFMKNSTRKPR